MTNVSRRVHILFYTCIENEGLVWCSACVFFYNIYRNKHARVSIYTFKYSKLLYYAYYTVHYTAVEIHCT